MYIKQTRLFVLLFALAYFFLVSSSHAQFSAPKVCRTDNFEITPLTTSTKTTIRQEHKREEEGNPVLKEKIELRVFDVFGTMKFRRLLARNFESYDLDLSDYPAGVYVVEVRQGCDITMSKVIRRHH
jgi:hypothetical protein